MKLNLLKDQKNPLMGRSTFYLVAKVELTAEERLLIEKYKVQDTELCSITIDKGFFFTFLIFLSHIRFVGFVILIIIDFIYGYHSITIRKLIRPAGYEFKSKDFDAIMQYQSDIIIASNTLRKYLIEMKNFGGHSIYEHNKESGEFELVKNNIKSII